LMDSVLLRIFGLLSTTDLIKVGMVCTEWNRLVSENEAEWKRLFKERWNVERGSPRALGSSSWKGAYAIWHQGFKPPRLRRIPSNQSVAHFASGGSAGIRAWVYVRHAEDCRCPLIATPTSEVPSRRSLRLRIVVQSVRGALEAPVLILWPTVHVQAKHNEAERLLQECYDAEQPRQTLQVESVKNITPAPPPTSEVVAEPRQDDQHLLLQSMEVVLMEVTVATDSAVTFEPEALERMHSLAVGIREEAADWSAGAECDAAAEPTDWLVAPFSEGPIWKVYERLPGNFWTTNQVELHW